MAAHTKLASHVISQPQGSSSRDGSNSEVPALWAEWLQRNGDPAAAAHSLPLALLGP